MPNLPALYKSLYGDDIYSPILYECDGNNWYGEYYFYEPWDTEGELGAVYLYNGEFRPATAREVLHYLELRTEEFLASDYRGWDIVQDHLDWLRGDGRVENAFSL